MRKLRWYQARAAAMTPREIAWRVGTEVRRRLTRYGTPPLPPANFESPRLRGFVLALADRESDAVRGAAEEIAGGVLSFWGRTVEVEPQSPAWQTDPFTGESWSHTQWRHAGRDAKPVWELQRQQHLVPLAAAAAQGQRADWARLVIDQTLDWIEQNPRERASVAWVSGYEAAHRLITWTLAIPLVVEHATEAERKSLQRAFSEHYSFVEARPSRFSSANNHRLVELLGLLAASTVTPGHPGWDAHWSDLEREAIRQVYSDGGSREQAAGYFLYVLETLWIASAFAEVRGSDATRIQTLLRSMLQWLAVVEDDDGEPPPVGDDAEDRILRLDYGDRRRAARIAERVASALGDERPIGGKPSMLLHESGYAILRTKSARVVFDVGELGLGALAAHGHADALSVLVDVDGQSVLRDSGTGSYVLGRDDDRASGFHNTVVVDGASQAQPLGPHLWGRRYGVSIEAGVLTPSTDYVRASHDGYRDVLHTRSVSRLGDEVLVILDRIRGRRVVAADLVWQPGPGLAGAPSVASEPLSTVAELPGRFSPRYTWTHPCPRLVWSTRGDDIIFGTAVSLAGGSSPPIALERLGSSVAADVAGVRLVEDWCSSTPEVTR